MTFQGFSKAFGLESLPFVGQNNNHRSPSRARHLNQQQHQPEVSDFGLDESELQGVELLDVRHPDSPYGLIQEVLQPSVRPFSSNVENDLGGLSPKEVFLSEGDLLILKGGTTNEELDNVWPPIDDYEAPYREPVFAPESDFDLSTFSVNPSPRNIPFEQSPSSKKVNNSLHTVKHASDTSSKAFDSNSVKTSTSSRVVTNDFRPSLQINPVRNVVGGGFLPVTPKYLQTVDESGNDGSNRINRQTNGFDRLITKLQTTTTTTTIKPVLHQQQQQQNPESFFAPQTTNQFQRQPIVESPISNFESFFQSQKNTDEVKTFIRPQENNGEGRTVIHGVYPRTVRQRSPFGASSNDRQIKTRQRLETNFKAFLTTMIYLIYY